MFFTDIAKNQMLDTIGSPTIGATFGSLHSAFSATGANELSGGSPAYTRFPLSWSVAGGGAVALAATLPSWNVPASSTIAWWGGWTAASAGSLLFMLPIGSAFGLRLAGIETTGDMIGGQITSVAHGMIINQPCVFWGILPFEIGTLGQIYYVSSANLSTNTFSVSLTPGGTSLTFAGAAPFEFFVQQCAPEVFGAQGTYSLSGAAIDLQLVA